MIVRDEHNKFLVFAIKLVGLKSSIENFDYLSLSCTNLFFFFLHSAKKSERKPQICLYQYYNKEMVLYLCMLTAVS